MLCVPSFHPPKNKSQFVSQYFMFSRFSTLMYSITSEMSIIWERIGLNFVTNSSNSIQKKFNSFLVDLKFCLYVKIAIKMLYEEVNWILDIPLNLFVICIRLILFEFTSSLMYLLILKNSSLSNFEFLKFLTLLIIKLSFGNHRSEFWIKVTDLCWMLIKFAAIQHSFFL